MTAAAKPAGPAPAAVTPPLDRQTKVDIARYFTSDVAYHVGQQVTFQTLTWVAYGLSQSSAALGALAFCYNIPFLFLSAAGGMIADRRSRKSVLMVGYAAQTIIAAALVLLEVFGRLGLPAIYAAALLIGSFSAIAMPSVVGVIKDFIKDDDLFGRLAGLASANTKVGRLVGSAVFGLLYGLFAAVGVFAISAALAAIAFVSAKGLRIVSEERTELTPGEGVFRFLTGGGRFLFAHRSMVLVLMISAVPIVGWGLVFFQLPAIVQRQYNAHHFTMGFLYAAGAVGGMLGGLLLVRRRSTRNLLMWSVAAAFLAAAAMLIIYFARHVFVTALGIVLLDLASILSMGTGNTALQLLSDDRHRGRVLAFFQMAVYGLQAFYSLVAGGLVELFGLRTLILSTAAIVAGSAVVYLLSIPGQRQDLEALYAARGIRPDDRPL